MPPQIPPGDEPVKPLTWQRAVVRQLAKERGVPDSTRLLVMALATEATGTCKRRPVSGGSSGWDFYLSDRHLMELTGLGERTIRRAKGDLIRRGMLVRVHKGNRTKDGAALHSVYRLALPSSQDFLPL